MTNEEIRKRFKFDIEMGVFEINKSILCYTFNDSTESCLKLRKLLLDIGMKELERFRKHKDDEICTVLFYVINPESSDDSWNNTFDTFQYRDDVYRNNKIPDYVKEYVIE